MLENTTNLQIGPLSYSHVVQKIAVQERKSVDVLETARSNRNFIVDSGESLHRAQIRFLFTGLDEINGGAGAEGAISGLRGLIALFRTCPIVSIRNKYLNTSWKKQDDLVVDEDGSVLAESKFYSDITPVTLDKLELENVPDLPFSIQATLSISRVEVGPVSEGEVLRYMLESGKGKGSEDPGQAYWLRKWITQVLESGEIPELKPTDFDRVNFDWYGKNAIGTALETTREGFELHLTTSEKQTGGIVLSENCTLSHRFAYNKLLGDIYSFPQHMGMTARSLSMDLVFNNQSGYETYEKFCRFKETSDEVVKAKNRFDRVTGWHIKSPISKLLGVRKTMTNSLPGEKPWEGVFVPVNVSSENGEQPDMINCRIDMLENNIDFYTENEVLLTNGGTDYQDLKKYFDRILDEEVKFRAQLTIDPNAAIREVTGKSDTDYYKSYQLFWPIEKGIVNLKPSSAFAVLNIDTMRAVLLDEKFDEGGAIRDALIKHPLANGQVIANRRVTLMDKLIKNGQILWKTVAGLDKDEPETARLFKAIKDRLKESFVDATGTAANPDNYFTDLALNLTDGLLGDAESFLTTESATGAALSKVFGTSAPFLEPFKEALFRVIVERRGKDKATPNVYSTDGVYSAFYKLITAFTLEKDSTITLEDARKEYLDRNRNLQDRSLYPDLLLPTYVQLYGEDRWREFAPSIEDMGIDTYNDQEQTERNQVPAVQGEDTVSPAAWFYVFRAKGGETGLRSLARTTAEAINEASKPLSISMPFNTNEIDDIKQLISEDNEEKGMKGIKTNKTLSEIIQDSLYEYKRSNPSGYREDLIKILSHSEQFEEGYLKGDNSLKVYLHHNGNYAIPREVNVPGLGAEIYRVIDKQTELQVGDASRKLDADAAYTTPIQKSVKFERHLDQNTKKLMDSSLDQIPDDQYSPERMFPSIKVYLIDRRGNDIIADDALFSVNAITSVDVTLDKNDAPLAVIKLADPLYTLQNDYFEKKNIVDKDNNNEYLPDNEKRVLASLREGDKDSYLKRYKLAQGRSIQIRMGYSAMAYNLPIIFTGRITEIVPGDQLTIVAQGWKAELINRKVSFYNDEPKNWGARDLAIQAITYSDPDGFGDYFPEFDSQFILRNLRNPDVVNAIQNSIDNYQNVDLEAVGSRGISNGISNYIVKTLGLRSTEKDDTGFDTRLKNIWYPDTSLYNNTLGLRSTFGIMPSFINDSWIIPLQPAWDALQEASRHAWNCVIDVVPYDNEATIFMGHPDQPYFYTRGTNLSKALHNKYRKSAFKSIDKTLAELMTGFLASEQFNSSQQSITKALQESKTALGPRLENSVPAESTSQYQDRVFNRTNVSFAQIKGLKAYTALFSNAFDGFLNSFFGSIDDAYEFFFGDRNRNQSQRIIYELGLSGLPAARVDALKGLGFYTEPATYLFSKFFGVPLQTMKTKWFSSERDITEMLGRNSRYKEFTEIVKTKIANLTGISYYDDSLVKYLEKEAAADYNDYAFNPDFSGFNSVRPIPFLRGLRRKATTLKDERLVQAINGYERFYLDNPKFQLIRPNDLRPQREAFEKQRKDMVTDLAAKARSFREGQKRTEGSILPELGITPQGSLAQLVANNMDLFKAFCYFFATYALEDTSAQQVISGITDNNPSILPPNMKVFRVHHFADDDHNIIQNNMVATTREMWNTVVIEHPSPGSAESTLSSEDQLYTEGRISSGTNWVYYPKQEVTGVIGLQFHPGLTLSNKKIKVFTELNCQSPELAAKLACGHLAQGIRKMYRGNILMLGKNIKPYDRLILGDKYTKMSGPVEVESVVHHWNPQQGWVTNVIPNAVCDANPGAGILQTAAMEAAFQGVYNTLEFVSDALMVATIVATAGAATPLAVGEFGIKKGISGLAKRFLQKGLRGGSKATLRAYAQAGRTLGTQLKNSGGQLLKSGQRMNALRDLFKNYAGPGIAVLKNELLVGSAEFATHMMFKSNVISAFVEASEDVEQLPVILAPILYNGNPFTAGLETEDSIWAISAFGLFYSARQLQADAARLYEDLFE